MAFTVALNNLRSRAVRSNVGENGLRVIRQTEATTGLWSRIKGFFGNLFDLAVSFRGWFIQNVTGKLSFSFTDAFGLFTQTVTFIYNFNWQATDEQLDRRIDSIRLALISQFGEATGTSLGLLICGIVPSAAIAKVNPLLGAYLLKNVGEEVLDEISGELAALIRSSFRAGAQYKIIKRFKNTRKAIKDWNRGLDPDSWERKTLDKVFSGNSDDLIKTWGDEDRKPWSFRIWTENKINSIPNPELRTFVEETYESFLDACVDAGYLIAEGLDSWILQQQMTADRVNGQERVVELQPDRENEDERYILAGGENEIRSQLPQVMTNYGLINNRDVGQWVGEPLINNTRANPSELTLRLQLYSNQEPPFQPAKQWVTITLQDVKRSALDWDRIKRALGGANGYMYGRFKANARLESGRHIRVYASSSNEAENRLNALAELVEPDILSMSVTEELKKGAKANGRPLEKKPIRVYPAYMYLENKQKILNQSTDAEGFQTLRGTYSQRSSRIELWHEQKPANFEETINELLRTQGAEG